MTIAYWCVLIAIIMPYVWVGISKRRRSYDNATPRKGVNELPGSKQRAYWAHENAIEAFAPFAAAVIIAQVRNAPQDTIDVLAIVFTVARVAYGLTYILDRSTLRSLVWFIGFGAVVALFFI